MLQVDEQERRTIGRLSLEQGQAHVVDGHPAAQPALGPPVVGVPMEDGGHGIAGERLLEPTRAEKRIDLAWLTLHRLLDRRVVQDGDALGRSQLRERRLELEGLVDGLPHESFDDFLAPGLERTLPEASAQPLGAGEAHAVDFAGFAVQQVDAGVNEQTLDLVGLVRFVVVVAEDGNDRHALDRRQLLDEDARFLGESIVGQIATENEHIGGGTGRGEERLEGSLRRFLAVQVPDRGQAHQARSTLTLPTSTFSAAFFSESMAAVHWATSSGVICPWGSRRPSA